MSVEDLVAIVEDLIDVMHIQAKDLEKLQAHVEQMTDRLGYESQLSLVASELAGLKQRITKFHEGLRGPDRKWEVEG